MKKISVVIPCYNTAQYLGRCMETIVRQTIGIENIEIILVDDASTDDGATLNLIMEYEKRFPDTIIAISLPQNLRQGGARNVGISYASGEYLMFCDADDWLALQAMQILYHTAKEYDADVVEYCFNNVTEHTGSLTQAEGGDGSYFRKMENEEIKRKFLMGSTEDFSLGAINKIYRLSMIQENHIRFAEQLICEEPSFTLPVRLYEKKHVYVDAALYFYFLHADNTVNSNWDGRKWDNVKVWLIIVEDMEKRGFLKQYHDELECMFYDWGFGLSIRMLVQKGYTLSKEEMDFLKEMVFHLFPDILENLYIREKKDEWDILMRSILETGLTEENVWTLNQKIRQGILEECRRI